MAVSIATTGARTWILTLGSYARKISGTVSIDDAFWSASFVGVSNISWETTA